MNKDETIWWAQTKFNWSDFNFIRFTLSKVRKVLMHPIWKYMFYLTWMKMNKHINSALTYIQLEIFIWKLICNIDRFTTIFANRWHQMTSDDIRWHQMTSNCIRLYQMTSDDIRLYKICNFWISSRILRYWNIEILEYWDI